MNSVAAFWKTARRRSEYPIKLQVSWNNFTLPPPADHWSPGVQLQTEAESKAGVEAAPQPRSPEVRAGSNFLGKRWGCHSCHEQGQHRSDQFRLQSDVM